MMSSPYRPIDMRSSAGTASGGANARQRCIRTIRKPGLMHGVLGSCCLAALVGTDTVLAAPDMEYAFNVRYRYELFDRDADAVTPPDATSKASTVRLVMSAKAAVTEHLGGFVEIESVAQVFEDGYSIPTIRGHDIPGYPVIADPKGTDANQAYVSYLQPAGQLQLRLGKQEIMVNNGRFISIAGWRQNHQNFNGFTASAAPSPNLKLEYGYLTRLERVLGTEASNGRADMTSHFFNLAIGLGDAGVLKTYGILLDFDDEPANSTDTYGLRFEGNMPLAGMRLLSTLEYASQREAGANPNRIDQDYVLAELGLDISNVAWRLGYNVLGASSAVDKFLTPLAHPFNGWTELFLNNPSLDADNHGLDARYLSLAAPVPGIADLAFSSVWYSYRADTGDASYGNELDLSLEYRGFSNTQIGWRLSRYEADELFSDALRTSIYMNFNF